MQQLLTNSTISILLVTLGMVRFQAEALVVPCQDIPQLEGALEAALAPQVRRPQTARLQSVAQSCSVELSDWVDAPLLSLTDRQHSVDGLNCWGSSLYLRGMRDHLFYAHDREFTFVVESSCQPVRHPRAGDIGAIRKTYPDGTFEELHAFVFLTPHYAISKQSYSFASPLEITAPEKFLQAFPGELQYFRCPSHPPPAVPLELDAFVRRLEMDYLAGRKINTPAAEAFYLPLIERLNAKFFTADGPVGGYAFTLFESTIWQYVYLYSSVQTPEQPGEI